MITLPKVEEKSRARRIPLGSGESGKSGSQAKGGAGKSESGKSAASNG